MIYKLILLGSWLVCLSYIPFLKDIFKMAKGDQFRVLKLLILCVEVSGFILLFCSTFYYIWWGIK